MGTNRQNRRSGDPGETLLWEALDGQELKDPSQIQQILTAFLERRIQLWMVSC